MLTKEIIFKELRKDGSLKTKTALTKIYSTQELYNFYHSTQNKKCEICQKETKFLNFKIGYDEVCSRSCRKKYNSNKYIPDFSNTITIEELKQFLIDLFSNCNTSNKLHISYFLNNNYIKEINTILKYMSDIEQTKLDIKLIHDLVYGCGICSKCAKNTTFSGFDSHYRETCSINCSNSKHINGEIDINYVHDNFIRNGKFLKTEMMKYYNVSCPFVNKWKVKNNIIVENKHKKYSYGEELLFKEFSKKYDVLSNNRTVINPYEIDIVIDKLCIEYDGLLFHSKGIGFPGDCSYRFKDKLIPEDYQLLTIFEDEFIDETKRKIWFSIIKNKLNQKENIINYSIKEIDKFQSNDFLRNNSLLGEIKSDINIGLFDSKNALVQILCVQKHGNKCGDYVITNLCTNICANLDYNLLLDYFELNYKPTKIKLILNKRWNKASEYEKYGFKLIKETEPNKFYFKVNVNKLFLDSGENEKDMLENNHRIIYDYGNLEMIKVNKWKS